MLVFPKSHSMQLLNKFVDRKRGMQLSVRISTRRSVLCSEMQRYEPFQKWAMTLVPEYAKILCSGTFDF